jgi:hypothetical protein
LISGSFSWTLRTSKYFKSPTFWLLDFSFGLRGWLKQKGIFLGKQIVTMSPAVHIKLSAVEHVKSNLLLVLFTTCCTAPTSHSMASETDQTLRVTDEPIVNKSKSDSGMESDVLLTSSSNMAAAKMANKTTSEMADY